ncbi:MAG: hypothetical protein COV72_04670 [Candidatus Omnitrophica bacterium CG11_big_fil_rev_8_21_14_0_20_42_13]|uniref:PTS EIIA type-2 domain-containing protein n=1 Tax=Candidatus Ghiorseimicrobium undicola TaxID=1974746 RepID=A0A2H0LXH2_9BACT|nr:MAG: hypothetical protein COV72_04670 [Candidatus Omnitrophica bacterium CG11_big_fil_rev_8_21_14_0_20_42_13]
MKTKELKKELKLLDIFCVSTGAMISSGLFILPGLAFSQAGPAAIFAYLLAGFFCLPTLFSMSELITAMPKAGGDYFYIMRGFGPLVGTIAGFSSWFALSLKAAFAILGISAYLNVLGGIPLSVSALWLSLLFVLINLIGVKFAGRFQVAMVFGLLAILVAYIFMGARFLNFSNFSPLFPKGIGPLFSVASFVFISYGGLTKVASLAEEVERPGRNLPLGMMLSLLATAFLYAAVVFVTIGVSRPESLAVSLTPVSDGARFIGGEPFAILIGLAAVLAFITTANAGIMTASRYPLGMSRDKLLPPVFQKVGTLFKTPFIAILFTGVFITAVISLLELKLLVKVASSILILLYIFANLTLILFRESKILSYRPKFRSPFYPYMQVAGILGGLFLLIEMGSFIIFLTSIFLLLGIIWYKLYAQKKVSRDSALMYALERLIAKDKELISENIFTELKDVVVARDNIIADRFHKLIENAKVLDIEEPLKMEDFFKKASDVLAEDLRLDSGSIFDKFINRERESSTLLRGGLAIPHIIIEGRNIFRIVLVRARAGIIFPQDKLAHIIFLLLGSSDERNLHLKALAAIAQITQNIDFDQEWLKAANEDELKNIVLLAERRRG